MGYWFENMEKMDIQEERRNTAKAREELEKAKQELEEARKEAEAARKESEESAIKMVVSVCQKHGDTKAQTIEAVVENCHLDTQIAEEKVNLYWKDLL